MSLTETVSYTSVPFTAYPYYIADSLHLYGYLVVDVWDHDSTNPDDFLGRVMLPLGEVPSDSAKEFWYPLMKRNTKDGALTGSLKLKTQLLVDGSKVFSLSSAVHPDKVASGSCTLLDVQ